LKLDVAKSRCNYVLRWRNGVVKRSSLSTNIEEFRGWANGSEHSVVVLGKRNATLME
jgi:hypothetical protein